MPNQHDVARLAQVSSASVSRYLNNPDSVKVRTAEKIREAIERIDYKIDYSAQTLKTGKFFHIGILAPAIGPFYWESFYAIQAHLNVQGYFSTFFFTRDVDTRSHNFRGMVPPFLNRRQLDGILYFPLQTEEDDKLLVQLEQWGKPFVVLDRQFPEKDYDQLYFDNYDAGRTAAQSFLDEGHREFLFIWGAHDSPAAIERFAGFSGRLAEEGVALGEDRQLSGDYTAANTYETAHKRFGKLPPFTAVFAANDPSALGFMRAAEEKNVHCPRDYSIIGFDDNLEFAPFLKPSLSTFRQPVRDFGLKAAHMLLARINGEDLPEHKLHFHPRFIRRESLGPVPKR